MALKRPTEKQWKYTQPDEPFPPTPSRTLFLGPSGSGKTTTLVSLILGPYKKIYDAIYVFSPSVEIDSAWDPVRDHVKNLKNKGEFFSEWDEGALRGILDKQRDAIRELKKAKSHKPLPQVLIILDDMADTGVMHHATGILTTLMIRGRHFGCSTWISSQKFTALSTVARVNLQAMMIWRLRNAKEIGAIVEELGALYDTRVLMDMYQTAVHDEDYSFWYLLLTAKKKEDMSWIRFEKKMILSNESH